MPVEIRELNIKGSVFTSGSVEKKFQETNSSILSSPVINQLKRDIIRECEEVILEKLERQKSR